MLREKGFIFEIYHCFVFNAMLYLSKNLMRKLHCTMRLKVRYGKKGKSVGNYIIRPSNPNENIKKKRKYILEHARL